MTQLETAMAILMKTFDTYTGGDKSSLNKTEMKTLIHKEIPGLLKSAKNPEEVNKLLKALDINGDDQVDFSEFVVLVTSLCCACHNACYKK